MDSYLTRIIHCWQPFKSAPKKEWNKKRHSISIRAYKALKPAKRTRTYQARYDKQVSNRLPRVPFRSIAPRKLPLPSPARHLPRAAATRTRKLRASLHLTRQSTPLRPGKKRREKAGWFGIQNRRASGTAAEGSPRQTASLSSSLSLPWWAGWLPSSPEASPPLWPLLVVALSYASTEESYRPVSLRTGG